jgi:RNA recognition motif-containing protein
MKMVNNLYFKNVPLDMSEADVKALFAPHGDIKSLIVSKNDIGQWGLVCYEDSTGKDKMHGPNAVKNATDALNDKVMSIVKNEKGEDKEVKMYIRNYLNKDERAREKFQETIRYKNSKKRCNLYVKNFPASWGKEQLQRLF